MHIVNRGEIANEESILKAIRSVRSAHYLFNKFLSSSAWSSL